MRRLDLRRRFCVDEPVQGAGTRGDRLRPWIALLVLKEGETLELEFQADPEAVNLPELTVEERANYGPADWLRRMSTQPVMLADAPHEVEAIPYEHIWGMAMEALERVG